MSTTLVLVRRDHCVLNYHPGHLIYFQWLSQNVARFVQDEGDFPQLYTWESDQQVDLTEIESDLLKVFKTDEAHLSQAFLTAMTEVAAAMSAIHPVAQIAFTLIEGHPNKYKILKSDISVDPDHEVFLARASNSLELACEVGWFSGEYPI